MGVGYGRRPFSLASYLEPIANTTMMGASSSAGGGADPTVLANCPRSVATAWSWGWCIGSIFNHLSPMDICARILIEPTICFATIIAAVC